MADLDRLITLSILAEGMRDEHGEFQDGPVIFTGQVWARYDDVGSGQEISTGGLLRVVEYRNFIIRWRTDLTTTRSGNIGVTDEDNKGWAVTRVSEEDARRRFMQLECTREG